MIVPKLLAREQERFRFVSGSCCFCFGLRCTKPNPSKRFCCFRNTQRRFRDSPNHTALPPVHGVADCHQHGQSIAPVPCRAVPCCHLSTFPTARSNRWRGRSGSRRSMRTSSAGSSTGTGRRTPSGVPRRSAGSFWGRTDRMFVFSRKVGGSIFALGVDVDLGWFPGHGSWNI